MTEGSTLRNNGVLGSSPGRPQSPKEQKNLSRVHLYILIFYAVHLLAMLSLAEWNLALFLGILGAAGITGRAAYLLTGRDLFQHFIATAYILIIASSHFYAGPLYSQSVALLAFVPIVFVAFKGFTRRFFYLLALAAICFAWLTQRWAAPGSPNQLVFDIPSLAAIGFVLINLYREHFSRVARDQQDLASSKDLMTQVMDQLPTIFWTKDLEGRYTRINRMGVDFLKSDEEAILGKTAADLYKDHKLAARLLAQDEEVIRSGKAMRVPREPFQQTDGSENWAIAVKAPIFNSEGEVSEIMGISTDITELVDRERELDRANKFLDQALRIGKIGTFEFDYREQQISWSDTMLELLEMPSPSLSPQEILARYVPAKYQEHLMAFGSDNRQTDLDLHYSIELESGKRKWFYLRCEKNLDRNGNPLSITGVLQDESKKTELDQAMLEVADTVPLEDDAAYFHKLTSTIGRILGVDYVYIGEAARNYQMVVAKSLYAKGKQEHGHRYPMTHTPSGTVLAERRPLLIERHVTKSFPKDDSLKEASIESYLGIPLFNSSEQLIGVLAVLHCSTIDDPAGAEQLLLSFAKRAGLELQHSSMFRSVKQEYFHKLIGENPLPMAMRRLDEQEYELVNRPFADMLGYDVQELIGADRRTIVAEEDSKRMERSIRALDTEEAPVQSLEQIYRRKDGSTFHARVNRIMINTHGEKLLIGWVEDIDEERKRQDAIIEREARYRRIFETNTVGIQECDLSGVYAMLRELDDRSPRAVASWIKHNPDWLNKAAGTIRVVDCNEAMLELAGDIEFEQLADPLRSPLYREENISILGEQILAIARGEDYFSGPMPVVVPSGEHRTLWFSVRFSVHSRSELVTYAYTDVTAQEEATRALQKSELRYRRLFESLNVGIEEIDVSDVLTLIRKLEEQHQGQIRSLLRQDPALLRQILRQIRLLSANQSMLDLAESTFEEMQEAPDSYFDDENILVFAEIAQAMLDGEESYAAEVSIKSRKGNRKTTWISVILPKQGQTTLIITWSDLSSLKRTEEALHDSEIRFATIVESAREIFVLADPEWGIKFISPSLERITGVPTREFMGLDYGRFIHPEDLKKLRDDLPAATEKLKAGEELVSELRLQNKHGEFRWFDVRTRMIESGRSSETNPGILAVARDIHERQQARQAMRNSERRFRLLFENGFDGILLLEAETRKVVMANEPLRRMLGLPAELSSDTEISNWMPEFQPSGEPSAEAFRSFEKKLVQKERIRREFIFLDNKQKPVTIDISAYLLREGSSLIEVYIFRDITARKTAESEARGLAVKAKEVEAMGRELTSHTLHITQRNKLLGELLEDLTSLEKSYTGELFQAVSKIRRKVDRNMDQGESWLNFKLYFERVHPDFFDKLIESCPKLSTNELKHCAYIRMNMSPNEVAEMLFVERKTVEVSRYRIKKKLGLGKGVSLIEFIRGL